MDASFHELDNAKARALHLLTCPLCTKQYEDPRVLPCQHTFCCRCLVAHVDRVQSSRPAASTTRLGAFTCPLCLSDVGLPAAGASAFPVDKRIRNIRDMVVDEMAKDLASRIKGRQHDNGFCNGEGDNVHVPGGSARLGKISERPGVDDVDVECGTWPSSARPRRFTDESPYHADFSTPRTPLTPDDQAFSRQRMGYSSVHGGSSGTKQSRTKTSANSYDDTRSSNFSHVTGETSSLSDTDTGGFGRNRPAYSSMHDLPRTRRRTRMTDSSSQSVYDSTGRSQGRSSFGNGHPSSLTPEPVRKNYQRATSNVEFSSKSSPFDNINRDDDFSETYTPIIGRHRHGYSSVRGNRHRPVFDPHQLFDNTANVMDEELSSSDRSSMFNHYDSSRVTYSHHTNIHTPTRGTSEFSENLWRTVSSDQNHTRFTSNGSAHERKQSESKIHEFVRTNGSKDGENRTGRQRPDNLDISGLTVLSHLPADIKTSVRSRGAECPASSADNHSESQQQLVHPNDKVDRQTNASESLITSFAVNEVSSASHAQNDVASQLADAGRATDAVNNKLTELTASSSTDSSSVSKPDNTVNVCLATAGMSTDNDGTLSPTNFHVDNQCSSSEEGLYSPSRSSNDSCFSRLTKFRASKNSRQAAASASPVADSTSKEAESPSSCLDESDPSTVTTAKPRVRKRPPAFVGTAFTYTLSASGSNGDAEILKSVDRNDELGSESAGSKKEHRSEGQSRCHPPPVIDSTVGDVHSDFVSSEKSPGLVSISSSQTAVDDDDYQTCSSDVSPTAESSITTDLFSIESNDVRFNVEGASVTQPQQHEEDSAVYSAGLDSDASVKSTTEPCMPTPTTDDDDVDDSDDVPVKCTLDESVSASLDDQHDVQKDVGCPLDDIGGSSLTSESQPADGTVTDFDVEHHQDDPELVHEVPKSEMIETGDDEDGNSGGILSTSPAPEELRFKDEQWQTGEDHHVNEDDVTSDNKAATEKDGNGVTGFRTSPPSVQTDDDQSTDGYVLATGLAALGDGSLVVADYGAGCVCLCDGDGRTDHRVTGVKPFSVAATSTLMMAHDDDELIYVGDRRRKTLVVLDGHGSDVAQWPDHMFDWICGTACLPDGQLAVLDRSRTRQLGIYATSGDDIRPLTELGGHGSALGDLCMAEFITADSLGRVLVADSGNHCVKAFDRRVAPPGVVAVYGTARGSGEAQLEWPKGVAVDSADNVLVADSRNARVVSFSVDGRPLGSVVPTVRGPFAVCTLPTSSSRRRRLAVTTHSLTGLSELHLYDYDTDAIFV